MILASQPVARRWTNRPRADLGPAIRTRVARALHDWGTRVAVVLAIVGGTLVAAARIPALMFVGHPAGARALSVALVVLGVLLAGGYLAIAGSTRAAERGDRHG